MPSRLTRSQQLIQILDTLFCDHLNTAESFSLSLCCSELYHAFLPYRVRAVRCSPVTLQAFAELLQKHPSCARSCQDITILKHEINIRTDLRRAASVCAEFLERTADAMARILNFLAEHSGLQRLKWHLPVLVPIEISVVERASSIIWNAMASLSEKIHDMHVYTYQGEVIASQLAQRYDWGFTTFLVRDIVLYVFHSHLLRSGADYSPEVFCIEKIHS